MHFCLLHCNSSTLVAAGEARDYADGSLFAFEDHADHEIINRDPEHDRIMLTVGVLHPDRLARAEPFPSPHQVLRYALDAPNATGPDRAGLPARTLGPALALAAYYGHADAVRQLLAQGAAADGFNADRTAAVHAACLGLSRTNDATLDAAAREARALAVVEVLVAHGADIALAGRDGTAADLVRRAAGKMGLYGGLGKRLAELAAAAGKGEL